MTGSVSKYLSVLFFFIIQWKHVQSITKSLCFCKVENALGRFLLSCKLCISDNTACFSGWQTNKEERNNVWEDEHWSKSLCSTLSHVESAESDWTLISSRCPHWTISPHPKTRTEQNLEKVTDQRVYAVVDVTLSACLLMHQLCFVSSVFASSVDQDSNSFHSSSPCMYACSCWMGNKGNIRVTLHWHAVSFDVEFSNRCFIFPALLGILTCRVALSLCDLVNTNTIICKHQFHCLHSKLALKLALLFTKSIKTKIRTFKSVSRATGAVTLFVELQIMISPQKNTETHHYNTNAISVKNKRTFYWILRCRSCNLVIIFAWKKKWN